MKHYGVSTKFSKPLQSNGKDIVVQYELKLEETLNCGGAYIKLLRERYYCNLPYLLNHY